MIIRRPKPKEGVCFAWKSKWTPDGTVWLEHVRFCYDLDGYPHYTRIAPSKLAFPEGKLCVVFDDSDARNVMFVEIENTRGEGRKVGRYRHRQDGLGSLEIDLAKELSRQAPLTR